MKIEEKSVNQIYVELTHINNEDFFLDSLKYSLRGLKFATLVSMFLMDYKIVNAFNPNIDKFKDFRVIELLINKTDYNLLKMLMLLEPIIFKISKKVYDTDHYLVDIELIEEDLN